ncbi:MAG: hypothetical protein WBA89_19220 [Microcoleus sp.]|uniref:hypothetical protein n=1 Tax=Microcoleus sp. TaxID=44472 RepID=UPI003C7656B5
MTISRWSRNCRLIDTKETVQIRALREQASAALEIVTNFIIVRYCTENSQG